MLTNFLIRTFVKDYKSTKDGDVRQSYGFLSGTVGIICNLLLFGFKLAMGIIVNSIAVMADAFNNLSDAASSVITVVGFKVTNKPSDKEHPFGHGRGEYVSALIVSFMVLLVGFQFIKSSWERIRHPEALKLDITTLIILIASILLKIWISSFNKKIGKAIGSKIMEATALDSLSDVITTSVVLFSLIISRWIAFPIDGYIGILVAIFIMYSGFNLIRDTLNPLLGEAPDAEFVEEIYKRALSYEGVMGIHDLIVHNYGAGRSVASLHVEIPATMNIVDAHELIDRIEREISENMDIHFVIHMDPVNTDDEEVRDTNEQIMGIVRQFPELLSIHDFRIVGSGEHKNVIFDLVVPHDYHGKKAGMLVARVCDAIEDKYPGYNAIITVDREYSVLR